MLNLVIALLGLFGLLFLIPHSNVSSASSSWVKYDNNPIFTENAAHLVTPSVTVNDGYHMFVSIYRFGGWNIGRSYSTDGINWSAVDDTFLSIGSADGWENEISDPKVLYLNNKYQMFYTSTNNQHWSVGDDRFRTRTASSISNGSWNKSDSWVMEGSIGKWDAGGTSRGRSVINKGGKFHMWYTATDDSDLSISPFWRIGYATSDDGIHWNKMNNGEPVIVPTEEWELDNITHPNVVYYGGKYHMWYTASKNDSPTQIVYAESSDGIDWHKPQGENPAIVLGEPGSFDSVLLSDSYVVKSGNQLKMYYGGFDGSYWTIGLANKTLDLPSVPLYKQTDAGWNNQVYDTAGNWTSGNLTIGRWGCAITSAVMVLKYYGYDLLPNGQELNPGTLNTWLKSQRDGYVGSGFTNWLAISRLTKQAKAVNNIADHDALEYSRTSGLPANFEDKLPLIVEEPGHFFVAKERNGDSISINDPFYNRNSIATSHNILSVGNYTPSNTDLSYMMLVYDPSFTVKIYDQNNTQVGFEYLQNPIKDADGSPLGNTQKIYLVQKPGDGKYKLSVVSPSTPQFLTLEGFMYDTEGNFEVLDLPKSIVGASPTNAFVQFTNEGGDTSTVQKSVSFDQILSELEAAYKSKYLPKSVYNVLSKQVGLAKKDHQKKRYAVASERLKGIRQQIIPPLSRFITDDYEIILKKDLEQLQTQI